MAVRVLGSLGRNTHALGCQRPSLRTGVGSYEGTRLSAKDDPLYEDRHLLSRLLAFVADQLPERFPLVWSDEIAPGEHPYRAVSGYNATLSLEWGRASLHHEGAFETAWSKKYPDSQVRLEGLDVLLHGSVIFRQSIALVDGGRCWIPWPEPEENGEGLWVRTWAVEVVGLANSLVYGTTDTTDYVRRAGIRIIDLPPWAAP